MPCVPHVGGLEGRNPDSRNVSDFGGLHYRAVQHSFILHYFSFSIHFYSRHVNNYCTISSDFTAVNAAIGLYAFCSSFGHIKQHIISRDFLNDSGAAVSEGIVPGGGSALLYCQGLGSFGG